ncbi:MAG: 3-oxoadipyl-CoA thiolase [Bacteroidetes bacterium]|jgi:acetyl-CoA acyltransferase|nr:3-oxoadipyl-CoA thiolase [Bacteroidota bacterium]MBP6426714.1 3-oxoadipyl-CoA thiolase [Bacteroidia bacterium]MBK8363423.1 3-oxoadipyl-CoA thiolase [Bacteroidota bacterium]MBK9414805.1 3-oxoadipyl-CoA thiolase [Bacteroidota bacterium]MBL0033394.1 3-oxoadipyl-CoA thiolase [Bacteroidota bacterium]
MTNAYIIDYIRTPIGSFAGTLAAIRTDDLAVIVLKEIIKRNPNVDFTQIGDVILGCANQSGEDNRNVARMAALMAGLPINVPGETVNRLCASGLSATVAGARAIMVGDAEMIIAGGVENMTRGPWVMSKTSTPYGRDAQLFDSSFGWRFINPKMKEQFGVDAMGETAENLVDRDKISRADQDKFSFSSQQKAKAAQERGRFTKEIVPVEIPQKKGEVKMFDKDEFMKPDSSLEGLSKLKPSFRKEGTVTAGNAAGLNDGAAALLLASEAAVKKYNLKPLAKIVSMGAIGVEPRIMGIGPVEAANIALKRAGISWNDIDIIELNEAFAAQSLAVIRSWGLKDDDKRINPNGGSIALGHPLGMSGARIIGSAALELHEQNKRYALATMCIGVGQGYAVVIEKV